MTREVFQFEVVFRKGEEPAGLSGTELLWVSVIGQVLMIGVDGGREWGALNVVSPFCQGSDDS